ncbi:NAD(P)-dependent oxidoreductase, partial [Actinomadura sp. BRA 177]|uniref:NAD-dependent epimerase/dehydratase family protein n=1 Tax=Actinomadura sp. BRA 177 TaxID=2745202 RepID=UPI0015951F84
MKRILLIGATGFIGRHVRTRATAAGFEVVAASRAAGPGDLRLDLAAGPVSVAAAVREFAPDAVVNCAGATRGEPADLVHGNVMAVANLVTALASAAPEARLVHLGSAAEYGNAEPGTPITESAPPRPLGVYGVTKLAGTELVRAAAGLDTVVLRVFNPVGPGSPCPTPRPTGLNTRSTTVSRPAAARTRSAPPLLHIPDPTRRPPTSLADFYLYTKK